jgi:hypothetical protein
MQCLACGAEMSLEQVIGDDSAPVPGFEHRTFVCSFCGDSEQRLAFVKQNDPGSAAAVPMGMAPSIAPSSSENNEDAAPGVIKRLFANLSAVYGAVERRLFVGEDKVAHSVASTAAPRENPVEAQSQLQPPDSAPEPELLRTQAPSLVAAETDNEIDECEALLKRAIELVQTPARSDEPSARDPEPQPAAPATSTNLPQTEVEAPPLGAGFSEAESAAPIADTNIPEKEIQTPTPASDAVAKRPPASPVVVEIQYDPAKARYIAKDIKTGLSILRTADHERLRQMCDRMGWQVVTSVPGTAGRESEMHSGRLADDAPLGRKP